MANRIQNIHSLFEDTLEDANIKQFRCSIQIQIEKSIRELGIKKVSKMIGIPVNQLKKDRKNASFMYTDTDETKEIYTLNDLFEFVSKLGISLQTVFARDTSIEKLQKNNGIADYDIRVLAN